MSWDYDYDKGRDDRRYYGYVDFRHEDNEAYMEGYAYEARREREERERREEERYEEERREQEYWEQVEYERAMQAQMEKEYCEQAMAEEQEFKELLEDVCKPNDYY